MDKDKIFLRPYKECIKTFICQVVLIIGLSLSSALKLTPLGMGILPISYLILDLINYKFIYRILKTTKSGEYITNKVPEFNRRTVLGFIWYIFCLCLMLFIAYILSVKFTVIAGVILGIVLLFI